MSEGSGHLKYHRHHDCRTIDVWIQLTSIRVSEGDKVIDHTYYICRSRK